MGFEHVTWAWFQVENIPLAAKAVLMGIANHATRKGVAYPSQGSLAKHLNISLSTVKRQIRELEKMGAIASTSQTINGRKTSNLYRLNMEFRGYPAPNEETAEDAESDLDEQLAIAFDGEKEIGQNDLSKVHSYDLSDRSIVTYQEPRILTKEKEEESAPDDLEEKFQELVDIFEPGPTEDLAHGRVALRNLQSFERATALKHAARFVEALKLEKRKQVSIANYLSRKRWESVERYTPRPVKAGEGKPMVFVAKDSPGWHAWAKFLGKSPYGMSVYHSTEHQADGWRFTSAMPPEIVGAL